jgi:acyl-CoA thioester hydrolase
MADAGAAVEHRFPVRVFYEDTDAAGIVYYANYLKFAERGRTEMLRAAGIGQRALRETAGVAFAVRRCLVDYLRPARLDDLLEVRTRILSTHGAAIEAEQVVARAAEELVRLQVTLVCIDSRGRATRLPETVLKAIWQHSSSHL